MRRGPVFVLGNRAELIEQRRRQALYLWGLVLQISERLLIEPRADQSERVKGGRSDVADGDARPAIHLV